MTDITAGANGYAFRFVNGAATVLFTRVTFVGGGGMTSGENQGVVRFSGQRNAAYVRFVGCTIGANSADGNGVSMASYGWSGGTYHHISFEGTHFLSSPRMSFECTQRSDGTHATSDGYDHIDFTGCVFEPAGSETISYDTASGRAGDSTITGCTFKGSGTNSAYAWGQTIEFNKTQGMTCTGNTVYRARGAMINFQGYSGTPTETVISGNTFDSTVDPGGITTAATAQMIYMNGVTGAQFTDNVVKGNAGGRTDVRLRHVRLHVQRQHLEGHTDREHEPDRLPRHQFVRQRVRRRAVRRHLPLRHHDLQDPERPEHDQGLHLRQRHRHLDQQGDGPDREPEQHHRRLTQSAGEPGRAAAARPGSPAWRGPAPFGTPVPGAGARGPRGDSRRPTRVRVVVARLDNGFRAA